MTPCTTCGSESRFCLAEQPCGGRRADGTYMFESGEVPTPVVEGDEIAPGCFAVTPPSLGGVSVRLESPNAREVPDDIRATILRLCDHVTRGDVTSPVFHEVHKVREWVSR